MNEKGGPTDITHIRDLVAMRGCCVVGSNEKKQNKMVLARRVRDGKATSSEYIKNANTHALCTIYALCAI